MALEWECDLLKIARVLAFALLAVSTPVCVTAQATPLNDVEWLSGCWLAGAGENTTEEVWLQPRGGLMIGMARSVRSGVATGYELLALRVVEGRLVLTAYPSGQQPADFQVERAEPGLLRVENRDHDFPQKIEYRQPSADSLVGSVFGDADDVASAFDIRYARAPCPAGLGSPQR